MRLAAVTGRFQPVHAQHLELFGLALAEHDHLVVAVTNPDRAARHEEAVASHRHTDAANPFTYVERLWLLTAALRGAGLADRAVVVPFDLTRPAQWPDYVPLDARQFVRAYSASPGWEREKARRLAAAGYAVTVLDGDPTTRVASTDIRPRLHAAGWEDLVPPSTVPVLRALLAAR